MALLHLDADLRAEMGRAGRRRFETYFDIDIMVERYRRVFFEVAPPIILVSMEGLVDFLLKTKYSAFRCCRRSGQRILPIL